MSVAADGRRDNEEAVMGVFNLACRLKTLKILIILI